MSDTCAVPLITGTAVFTGGGGGGAWTTPVTAEVATPEPPALLAVTTTSIVCPTSLDATVYVLELAPEML
jgi:hypothetical protein